MDQISRGLSYKKNDNRYAIMFLHYSADPVKTEEWAAEARASYNSLDTWRQEMELDFTKTEGTRVYDKFTRDKHITGLKPVPHRDIWRGWDFGYRHPACVWMQVDNDGCINVLCELFGTNTVIQDFAKEVKRVTKELFHGYKVYDAGDPSVRHASDKSERTTADILKQNFKIRMQSRILDIIPGINLVRSLVNPRFDGTVMLKVDEEKCPNLVDGFMGGYVMKEDGKPDKDYFYDHLFDALRYGVTVLFNPRTGKEFKKSYPFLRTRETASPITGY